MSMVFRATDEPAASRPDYWRHVICERFRPMEVRFADGPGSHDELLTGVIGALRVTESTSSAGEVHRTSKHVSRSTCRPPRARGVSMRYMPASRS